MVKIKDFTLASKKRGALAASPRALHTSHPFVGVCSFQFLAAEVFEGVRVNVVKRLKDEAAQ